MKALSPYRLLINIIFWLSLLRWFPKSFLSTLLRTAVTTTQLIVNIPFYAYFKCIKLVKDKYLDRGDCTIKFLFAISSNIISSFLLLLLLPLIVPFYPYISIIYADKTTSFSYLDKGRVWVWITSAAFLSYDKNGFDGEKVAAGLAGSMLLFCQLMFVFCRRRGKREQRFN